MIYIDGQSSPQSSIFGLFGSIRDDRVAAQRSGGVKWIAIGEVSLIALHIEVYLSRRIIEPRKQGVRREETSDPGRYRSVIRACYSGLGAARNFQSGLVRPVLSKCELPELRAR